MYLLILLRESDNLNLQFPHTIILLFGLLCPPTSSDVADFVGRSPKRSEGGSAAAQRF